MAVKAGNATRLLPGESIAGALAALSSDTVRDRNDTMHIT